jgi:hypothetical protein
VGRSTETSKVDDFAEPEPTTHPPHPCVRRCGPLGARLPAVTTIQARPLGLAVGAALAVLIGGIPLLGPLLQPLSAWVATLYGAGVGAAMQKGDYSGSPITAAICRRAMWLRAPSD